MRSTMFSSLTCRYREEQQGEEKGYGGTWALHTDGVTVTLGISNEYILMRVISVISNQISTVQSANNPIKSYHASKAQTQPPEATRQKVRAL